MADPRKIEAAVKSVRNQKAFIQDLLIDALGWDIDDRAEDVEDITFEWSAEELRANDLDKQTTQRDLHRRVGPGSIDSEDFPGFEPMDALVMHAEDATGTGIPDQFQVFVPARDALTSEFFPT